MADDLIGGKGNLRCERLDLARLVRVAVEDDRHVFEHAGLCLVVETPEVPVWVAGDLVRLTQAIDILLQNALKFTERGGKVAVRVQVEPGGRLAILTVHEAGAGLELCLPRVQNLVERQGGQVSASSKGSDAGSELTIRLSVEPEPAALTQMLTEPDHDGHHLRILVVEDNHDSAESLRMLLELYGYEVTVAYTGPDGVKTAEEWKPNVVLCDIGLPGLDGYGVARQLRRNPATAKTPMIAVTGYGAEEDRHRSREAGFDRHMVKPVDPEVLHQALAALG